MNQGFPRLLGDIGGTNARWAWQEAPGAPIGHISVQACAAHGSIEESVVAYLQAHGLSSPRWAGIGIATAVTGDAVRMTNNPWQFSIAAFQRALGLERCLLVNDFTALALSLPALKSSELACVGQGQAVAGAPIALIGPGTGLGVSGLIPNPSGGYIALGGEGGHATLPAMNDYQAQVLEVLRRQFPHVSAERVLSGSGLVLLYRALCEIGSLAPRDLQPADVTDFARNGSDAQCLATVRLFTQFLGVVAGNLALTLGAFGGVYLGGGVVPRMGHTFDHVLFRQSFEAKGRYQAMLAGMPVWLITAATPALTGASQALDTLPHA